MNRKTKDLLKDIGYSEHESIQIPEALDIRADRIRQLVNSSLDSVPQEKRRHTRQKRMKAFVILAAVLALSTATVLAASRLDFLKHFFPGDLSYMDQYVETREDSVTDGKFTVTLEQVLTLENRSMLIYSVEGVTAEAHDRLMSRSFHASVSLDAPENPEDSGPLYYGMSQHELTDLRTDTKRFFSCSIDKLNNPQGLPIYFSLDIMANEDRFIEIPMDNMVAETLNLTLNSPSGKTTIVKMSPMDILIEKDITDGYGHTLGVTYMDVYFRMEDGSIKTYNELFQWSSCSQAGGPTRYIHAGISRQLLDFSQFKAIIVEGLEYGIKDTAHVTEVQVDERLRPMEMPYVYMDGLFMIPLEEAFDRLGGEITFDEGGQKAVIEYRGSTYEVRAGEETFLQDGMSIEFSSGSYATTLNHEGTLYMGPYAFSQCFYVNTWVDMVFPKYESIMYVIP